MKKYYVEIVKDSTKHGLVGKSIRIDKLIESKDSYVLKRLGKSPIEIFKKDTTINGHLVRFFEKLILYNYIGLDLLIMCLFLDHIVFSIGINWFLISGLSVLFLYMFIKSIDVIKDYNNKYKL